MNYTQNDITVIILAGGLGRRLKGQNKGLLSFAGKTLIEHVIDRLQPQTEQILINANQDLPHYQLTNFPVVQDKFKNYQGPLAGILSCRAHIHTPLVLTVPCDAPLLPMDLLERMLNQYQNTTPKQLCVAHDGTRLQNLFMLFNSNKFKHLDHFFKQNHRKVSDWIRAQDYTQIDFSDVQAQFINVNTEETLNALKQKFNSNEYK